MRKFILKKDFTILDKPYKRGEIVELGQEGFLRYEEVLSLYREPKVPVSTPTPAPEVPPSNKLGLENATSEKDEELDETV